MTIWVDPRVEKLRVLWGDGFSASECARALGSEFGVFFSRSAIIGKVFRLGLGGRPQDQALRNARNARNSQIQRARARVKRQAARVRRTIIRGTYLEHSSALEPTLPREPPADTIPMAQRKSLIELSETTCRWPYGDPHNKNFFFCGAEEAKLSWDQPYCRYHAAQAYQSYVMPQNR